MEEEEEEEAVGGDDGSESVRTAERLASESPSSRGKSSILVVIEEWKIRQQKNKDWEGG